MAIGAVEAELRHDRCDVGFDGPAGEVQSTGDSGIGQPLGYERQHLGLPLGKAGQGTVRVADEPAHNLRIENGAAVGNVGETAQKFVDVLYAVLEQVAETRCAGESQRVDEVQMLAQ